MSRIVGALTLSVVFLIPAMVHAQASIAGTVKDSSGAVLPGVTVEASSDVLIEKVRIAVTDGSGLYRIVDLVPGTYTVTFSLASFSTFKREGLELSGSLTATIDAELRPGSIAETVVVTGTVVGVDVQSPRRQQVLDRAVITDLPVARTFFGLAALTPGIEVGLNAQDGGGINAPQVNSFSAYGGRLGEGRLLVDGVSVGGSAGGSGTGYYTADVGNAQEVSLTISGGLGEAETGGPVMNVVPRTGGNTLRGQFYYNYANDALQSDNRTSELLALNPNLRRQDEFIKFQEVNGSFGGPLRRDRLWYYWSGRVQDNDQYLQNIWFNKNAGDPTKWTYDPDYTRPAFSERNFRNASLRLTWQVTSKQKLNIFWDEQSNRAQHKGGGSGTSNSALIPNSSPEASDTSNGSPQRVSQVTWQSPRTNRLLVEGRFNRTYTKYGNYERKPNPTRGLVRVTEQTQPVAGGTIVNLAFRAQRWNYTLGNSPRWEALTSYVTGAHNFRVGYQGFFTMNEDEDYDAYNDQRITIRTLNGVPNQITMYLAAPMIQKSRVMSQALYVQDQYTRGRLTLGAALRFDYAKSWFPDLLIGPDVYIPRGLSFEHGESVRGFKDLSPRVSAAYDLFGTGKTAVKFNLGRYLEAATNGGRYTNAHPQNRLSTNTTRSWTDENRNFIVDCNLHNLGAQDLRASGGDQCGATLNQEFGQIGQFTQSYDPALLAGWRIRPNDWQIGASVQQEVLPRVTVELAYNRRLYGIAPLSDDRSLAASDFDRYTVVGPVSDRLGDASGRVLDDQWNMNAAAAARARDVLWSIPTDDQKEYNYWHGFDINANARTAAGLTVRGGVSIGREVTDDCNTFIAGTSVTENPTRRNCHRADPFQPRWSALGLYTVPKVDVAVSGTFLSRPGAERSLNVNVPTSVIAASLGRPVAGVAGNTVMINFLNPGELFGERVNELDLKVAKVIRLMGKRATAGFEIFNVMNWSTPLTYNGTWTLTGTNPGATWGQPTGIQPPRYARFSLQVDF
jgi:hypothetical protein